MLKTPNVNIKKGNNNDMKKNMILFIGKDFQIKQINTILQ